MDPIRPTILALALVGAACAPTETPQQGADATPMPSATEWTTVDHERLTPQQQQALSTARAARDALMRDLLAELSRALDEGGPAVAIAVCNERAPEIAAQVARDGGVRIGRTSFRLRNPDNQPPRWAEGLVAARRAEPAVLQGDGKLALLHPIRLKAECEMCHGGPEDIPDGVAKRLAEMYPDDQATEFAPGELRGWVWVEVPVDASLPSS